MGLVNLDREDEEIGAGLDEKLDELLDVDNFE